MQVQGCDEKKGKMTLLTFDGVRDLAVGDLDFADAMTPPHVQ
jgi:hypothetical protein